MSQDSGKLRQWLESNPEMLALTREHGIDLSSVEMSCVELSDMDLDLVAGGKPDGGSTTTTNNYNNSKNYTQTGKYAKMQTGKNAQMQTGKYATMNKN